MKASIYQERFWLEWELDPLNPKYNESLVYNIKGNLDLNLLKSAFLGLLHKHPILKSQFTENNDRLNLQLVNFEMYFEVIDIDPISSQSIDNLISQIINIPFDLQNIPLWRAKILRSNNHDFWLVVVFHHIIIDGNSFELFRNDLSQFYNKPHLIAQTIKDSKKYELDFEKYLKKENSRIKDYAIRSGLQYYEEKLVHIPLQYEINTSSNDQVTFFFSLANSASKQLKSFCKKNKCNPFRFISAVFAIFLYKYFGQKKFCIAYPVNMRPPAKKNMLGSFINMQLFPIAIDLNTSFKDVLFQIIKSRESTQDLALPYEKIISHLKQKNIIDTADSINVVISETDLKLRAIDLSNLQSSSIQVQKTSLPFDISFEYQFDESNVYIQLSVKNHWFDRQHHGEQLRQHLSDIIKNAINYFQTPLYQLSLIRASQLQSMMNLSEVQKSFSICSMRIEKKFEQIVKQYPNQVAIIDLNRKTTYSQLAQMAETIAINLASRLRHEAELVGITMRHSAELVAVIIALFKLGKAYLPIRADLPTSYMNEIISSSKLKVIITDQDIQCEIEQLLRITDLRDTSTVKLKNIKNNAHSDIAYILYTSGTTGIPKGVMIKHESIVNLVSACQSFYNLSERDVIPWFHSYSFDFSVWEIWSALLNGAGLLILNECVTRSPREFTQYVSQYNVTVINQTPTALKQWLGYLAESNESLPSLSSVRIIISGGEALYSNHVEAFLLKKTALDCRIFNMYGITEDAVHSTIFEVTINYLEQKHSIIGKMLPGKVGLVVDENNNIMPIGCTGELLISGFGVSEGYLNQISITQERFIQLSEIDSKKIWLKTGDQVRSLPSGDFEYVGRKDSQIKMRGYRIDSKDIEIRLGQLKAVKDIKIIAAANALLAFVVLDENTMISEISDYAKTSLPYYMIPSKFIRINLMPRTINNKINEKKLLKMEKSKQEEPKIFQEKDSDKIMLQIAEIWKKVLLNSEFNLDDNFFDCGGNSILLVNMQNLLEAHFSIKVPMVEFFKYPTIVDMARRIKQYI
jgi:amino acid adenylation domain-containing protein